MDYRTRGRQHRRATNIIFEIMVIEIPGLQLSGTSREVPLLVRAETHRAPCRMLGFSWWLSTKEFTCNAVDAGDMGSIPGSGRSSGKGHGNPLQYSCLENHMDRGAWWAIVRGVTKSWTRLKQLSTHQAGCDHED